MAEEPKARFINPPHSLGKAIVGTGPARIDKDMLERAEAAISGLQEDFPNWAGDYIEEMRKALAVAQADISTLPEQLPRIFTQVMDLKGLAGSYGFPMLSEIGDLLKKYTEGRDSMTSRDLTIVEAHIDAMHVVLRDQIKGDGGDVGRAVVAHLQQLLAKA